MSDVSCDLLAIGPHPDDLEIGCGGTIKKLTDEQKNVVILDLSRGEMSSRGDIKTREKEAKNAAKLLGVSKRLNADLKDTQIFNNIENQKVVVRFIRELKPKIVLAPYWLCRHPDHYRSSELVYESVFLSGLKKHEDGLEPFRPDRILYYMLHTEFTPTFVVDITEQINSKKDSLLAYESQFSEPKDKKETTYIAGKAFLDHIEVRSRYYGSLIGKIHGEPFIVKETLEIQNPIDFLNSQGKTLNKPMSSI